MPAHVAWDTETARFGPGRQAPRLACISARSQSARTLIHWTEAEAFFDEVLYDRQYILVGHNICYDLAVVAANNPKYLHAIFQLFEDGRVRDTMLRQKLIDIACGVYRGYYSAPTKEDIKKGYAKGAWIKLTYDLDAVSRRHLRRKLDKDTWRLRYGELIDLPLDEWPQGAKDYPMGDVDATWDVFWVQEDDNKDLRRLIKRDVPDLDEPNPLHDEIDQCKAAWWLALMRSWGIRTNPAKVNKLRKSTQKLYDKIEQTLVNTPLCPLCGIRLKGGYCDSHGGAPWKRTKMVTKKLKDGTKVKVEKVEMLKVPGSIVRLDGTRDQKLTRARMVQAMGGEGNCRRTPKGGIQLDEEACEASNDELLKRYAELSKLKNVIAKDIPALLKGRYLPIHSNFDVILATGRTSSSKPNIQNIRRLPGIRECFVPREGKVFLDADYDGLELRTLAQVCINLFGYSELANVLNRGDDPHLMFAAQFLGISYEEAVRRKKDNDVKDARQFGKIANFGFPGGLGYDALIDFAKRPPYRRVLTRQDAERLKQIWFQTFPEMRQYFAYIDRLCKQDPVDNLATIQHFYSKRIRGYIKYTVACNSYFQGLGADATKAAGWLIAKACYIDQESPLYGCRIVNYIHDQFLLECDDDDRAHDAAMELRRLMILGAAPYLPDVPATVSDVKLARCFSKDSEAVYDDRGRLIPWDEDMKKAA